MAIPAMTILLHLHSDDALGLRSFGLGLVVSVLLFSNQEKFVGYIARAVPALGDITFFVGFLIAGASYLVLCRSKITAERHAV